MVGLLKGVFLIKYKIKEFERFKNLISLKGFIVWFKGSLVITLGGATVSLRLKGKTVRDFNKKKGIFGIPDNRKRYIW